MSYIDTIEGLAKPEIIKIKPNPKDIRPVLMLVKKLNRRFHREEKGLLAGIAWYGFFPWERNENKEWVIACTCLSTTRDRLAKAIIRGIENHYPELKLNVQCVYGERYFDMREEKGMFI